MKTVCIIAGNTDNKLSQHVWSEFVFMLGESIRNLSGNLHFSGGSEWYRPWQNACWVIEIEEDNTEPLKTDLKRIREIFNQESLAWIEGETLFL